MVQVGDTLQNPISGETFIILRTAEEIDGERFYMETCVEPHRGIKVPAHYHPSHMMRLSIQQGAMLFWMGSPESEQLYQADAELEIPVDVPYHWRASGGQELRFATEFQPAGDWAKLFESMCAIGQAASKGEINHALAPAYVFDNLRDQMYFARPPAWLQVGLLQIIAALAGIMGYSDYYEHRGEGSGFSR